ncbi:MAG: type II toxin-antitoxin system RelE/ParE family toxin [Pseudomonadota bacterium]
MADATSKPPRWSARASAAYANTLDRIAAEDPPTAEAVYARVERSVALICSQPGLGTPTATLGVRRHPIPGTGHIINYRLVRGEIRILRWYRARQSVRH